MIWVAIFFKPWIIDSNKISGSWFVIVDRKKLQICFTSEKIIIILIYFEHTFHLTEDTWNHHSTLKEDQSLVWVKRYLMFFFIKIILLEAFSFYFCDLVKFKNFQLKIFFIFCFSGTRRWWRKNRKIFLTFFLYLFSSNKQEMYFILLDFVCQMIFYKF